MDSLKEVISEGFCIGCGGCKYNTKNSNLHWNERGELIPLLDVELENTNSNVCPFSSKSLNETQLAELFFDNTLKKDFLIGKFSSLYVGQVKDQDILKNSSSGGMLTWINKKLLELNLVDGIIAVKESKGENLFEYSICSSPSELGTFSKSRYYPIEFSQILNKIKNNKKKYALVTLPCFAKSIRNLQLKDALLKKQIPYVLTLICGHLKTKNYSEYIGWQAGISPAQLNKIDFRVKDKNQPASKYSAKVSSKKEEKFLPFKKLKLNDWGLGLFKPKACDYCDDVFGELGDITVGDAWLPKYINDPKGNSVVVIRNKDIQDIFTKYQAELNVDYLSIEDLHESQKGGIAHKRKGLSARIAYNLEQGKTTPKKRENLLLKVKGQKEYDKFVSRLKVSEKSHSSFLKAKKNNELNYFYNDMQDEINTYYKNLRPAYIRFLKMIKDFLTR